MVSVPVGVTVCVMVCVTVFVAVKVGVAVGASDTSILFEVPVTDGFPFSAAPIVLMPVVFNAAVNECTPASPGLNVYAAGSAAAGSVDEKITVPE